MKKTWAIFLFALLLLGMTGCGVKDAVYEKETEDVMSYYKKGQLEDDYFYVKDGTDFMKVMKVSKTASVSNYFNTCVPVLEASEIHIPTLYKGEILAYQTKSSIPDAVTAIRLMDMGYTIGAVGMKQSLNGYAYQTDSLVSGSSAAGTMNAGQSAEIKSIHGRDLTAADFTSAGTLANLHKDEECELKIYVGSKSATANVVADTRILIPESSISITDYALTQNGYVAYTMPSNAKSGYYMIDTGLFRYIAQDRTSVSDESTIDFNEGCTEISADLIAYNLGEGEDPTKRAMTETPAETEESGISYAANDESTEQGGTLSFEQTLTESYSTLNFSVGFKSNINDAQIISVWCEGPDGVSRSMIKVNDVYTMQTSMEKTPIGKYTVKVMGNEIHRSEVSVQAVLGSIYRETETEEATEAETNAQPETFIVTGDDGRSYVVSGSQYVPQQNAQETEKQIFTQYEQSGTMAAPEGGTS